MSSHAQSVITLLASVDALAGAVADLDLASVEGAELEGVVGGLRCGQAAIEGALVQVGLRADRLAAAGRSAPSNEVLAGRGAVRAGRARREAARAALADRCPTIGQAMTGGRLGPDHLDALARRLGPVDDETLDRLQPEALVADAARLPADTFDASLRRQVQAATDHGQLVDTEAKRAASEFRHWFNRDTGMGHISGRFDPERYEALVSAVDQHTSTLANAGTDGSGSEPLSKNANLAAAALVDLVCSSGARQAHLPHITVVVDHDTITNGRHPHSTAQTGDGHDLSDETTARLCCDAVLRRVVLDDQGVPVDVGRRYRTATDAQWAAIRALHTTCAWNGCQRPLGHCQAHHLQPWQSGGRTDLDNLLPLCSQHHHLVHEGRWHLELLPDRALRITRPDGQHHTTTPQPTRRPPPPLDRHRTLTTT